MVDLGGGMSYDRGMSIHIGKWWISQTKAMLFHKHDLGEQWEVNTEVWPRLFSERMGLSFSEEVYCPVCGMKAPENIFTAVKLMKRGEKRFKVNVYYSTVTISGLSSVIPNREANAQDGSKET